MSLTISASGTVAASDVDSLLISRSDSGDLVAEVVYFVNSFGERRRRHATWALSAAEKSAISSGLLPGALAAISSDLGL